MVALLCSEIRSARIFAVVLSWIRLRLLAVVRSQRTQLIRLERLAEQRFAIKPACDGRMKPAFYQTQLASAECLEISRQHYDRTDWRIVLSVRAFP
jgi:hypothetical protein